MSAVVMRERQVAAAVAVVARRRSQAPQQNDGKSNRRHQEVVRTGRVEQFDQRCLRGAGSLARAEIYACKKFAGNIREQIRFLTAQSIPAGTGITRGLGNDRRNQLRQNCEYMLVDGLRECAEHMNDPAVRINNTTEFTSKHLLSLLALFGRMRLKSSTMHKYLSSLRKLMTLLGRRHLVPGTDDLMLLIIEFQLDVDLQMRGYSAFRPLCWSVHVNIDAVLESIRSKSPHAHFLCCLCLHFGLRLSEALRLRPQESDRSDFLHLQRGTKGNRPRDVPLSSDPDRRSEQRRLLREAKQMCEGDQHLGFGGRNLQQARKYFEAVLAECGVTRTQLGITLHGLRHEYAVRRFEELTGLPAPVLRQAPIEAYIGRMDAVRAARGQIAEELGHGRAQVSSAYFGALPILREELAKAQAAASALGRHGQELGAEHVADLSVAVRKVAARRYEYILFARLSRSTGEMACRALVDALKTSASRLLQRKVEVRTCAAPAQAGVCVVHV